METLKDQLVRVLSGKATVKCAAIFILRDWYDNYYDKRSDHHEVGVFNLLLCRKQIDVFFFVYAPFRVPNLGSDIGKWNLHALHH